MKYIKETKGHYLQYKVLFKNQTKNKQFPIMVSFKFVRGSKHKFDYINPAQTVQDLMVKNGWIEDDNCDCMIPSFKPYEYNKENPGVYIEII
tara:strand:+ start:508 stop:783 length:276 start_codon:yes stop_codon:yes gene_type:complete